MRKYLVVFLVLLINIHVSKSQDNGSTTESVVIQQYKQPNNKIGFAGSMFSGYGLSYEYNVNNNYTIEFTGSVFGQGGDQTTNNGYSSSSYGNSDSYLVATLGTELQRNLFFSHDSRFYTFIGLSYWIDNTDYPDGVFYKKKDYAVGLGLGWEFFLGKRIVMNIEGGYLYQYKTETGAENTYIYTNGNGSNLLKPYNDRNSYHIGFGIGGGVYYTF